MLTNFEAEKRATEIINSFKNSSDRSLTKAITYAILYAYNEGWQAKQKQLTDNLYPRSN